MWAVCMNNVNKYNTNQENNLFFYIRSFIDVIDFQQFKVFIVRFNAYALYLFDVVIRIFFF